MSRIAIVAVFGTAQALALGGAIQFGRSISPQAPEPPLAVREFAEAFCKQAGRPLVVQDDTPIVLADPDTGGPTALNRIGPPLRVVSANEISEWFVGVSRCRGVVRYLGFARYPNVEAHIFVLQHIDSERWWVFDWNPRTNEVDDIN